MIDPKNLRDVCEVLREFNVGYFKTSEIELTMSLSALANKISAPNNSQPKDPEVSPEEEKEIKHKVEELTSLMRLSDTDLVDRLFPDHTQDQDEEAS
jgi:hypothetical protein